MIILRKYQGWEENNGLLQWWNTDAKAEEKNYDMYSMSCKGGTLTYLFVSKESLIISFM